MAGQAWRAWLKRYRAAAVAAVLVALAGAGFGYARLLGPRVRLAVAARGDLVQTVVASGHVEAPHRVSIGTQIVGTVRQVPVAEGQAVKAGQTLVVLDSAELAAAAQQADVAVQQAQARLRQIAELQAPVAQQQLRQAQVNADNARRQWRRQQDLYRQGFIGEAALDDARKAVDLADAQLHAAHKQLDTLQPSGSDHALAAAELAQAQASAKAARARLGYATIAAPSDGVLISRDVEPGDVVQPGKALMVLSPAGETQLVVQIDEKNLGLLALGQSAQASADAYPSRRFGAELVYINPGVDAQSGSVEVKLRVPSPPAYLLQDMTVSVDIEVARRQQAVLLPADAVHDDPAHGAWVLRVDEGRAHRQAVQLGVRSGGVVEVLQGVQPGDRLVPAGEARVRDGSRVREAARG
jgi:HlyD family secretion protein